MGLNMFVVKAIGTYFDNVSLSSRTIWIT